MGEGGCSQNSSACLFYLRSKAEGLCLLNHLRLDCLGDLVSLSLILISQKSDNLLNFSTTDSTLIFNLVCWGIVLKPNAIIISCDLYFCTLSVYNNSM